MPRRKGSFWSSGKWQGISALATVVAALISVLAVVGLPGGAESPSPIPVIPAAPATPALPASPAPSAVPAAPALPGALGSISGSVSVSDVQGQPIVGASVYALVYKGGDKAGEKRWSAETDGSGHYQIKNIPAGNYQVTAWAPNYVRMHWKHTLLRDNAIPVSVTAPNDTANINFKLEPGGTISGTVKDRTTGKPLVNVSVTAGRVDGEGRSRTTTDQKGNYTISGLPFGKYKVNSPIGDGWGSGDDGYITEYYKGKKDAGSADLVTITVQNPDVVGVDFGLLAPPAAPAPAPPAAPGAAVGSISGYVYDAQGQPIVGASVDALDYKVVYKFGEQKWQAETDGSGHYQIKNIPAGNYHVVAWAPNHVRKFWKNTLLGENATPVSVTAPNDTANINFKLEPGGTISGAVKDRTTGQPLVNVSVTAVQGDGEGRGRTTTDQKGNYTISGLPFGKYKVNSPIGDGWGSGDDGYITEYFADPVTITVQNPDAAGINFGITK